MRSYKNRDEPLTPKPRSGSRRIVGVILAVALLWFMAETDENPAFTSFLVSRPGRALLAVVMTALVGFELYRGKTLGRFSIDSDESPNSFGFAVIIEALVAAGFWLSLLA